MTYLLDTDTCIGWLNRRHPALLYHTAEFNRVPDLAVEDWLAEPTP